MSRRWLGGALGLFALGWTGVAWAGPPYVTDDAEPTDTGHWEIYNFASGVDVPSEFDGQAGLDINYGPAKNLQLTAVVPLDIQNDRSGLGDVQLAVKYRFLQQSEGSWTPDVAFFPRLFTPTSGGRYFESDRLSLLLPIWAEKDWGKWSLFGGGGYDINPGAGNRNFWLSGIALARQVSDRLQLGGEIYHQTAAVTGGRDFTGLNAGAIYKLTDHWSLLVAAGPGIENARQQGQYDFYLALEAQY